MRLAVGLGLLGLGVIGLGWLGRASYAPHVETLVTAGAQQAIAGSVHGATARVEGRDITAEGLADGPTEQTALIAALQAVHGRRVVHDRLTVLPVADPIRLVAEGRQGTMSAQGQAPDTFARDRIVALAPGDVTLAAGAPDRRWGDAAVLGLGALRVVEEGRLEISGRDLHLSGLARTPTQADEIRAAITEGLPQDYTATYDFTFLDDGTPPAWRLDYDASTGGRLEGKLPRDLPGSEMARALGLTTLIDASRSALLGDPGTLPAILPALAPWLAEFETLSVTVSPEGTLVEAGLGAGADRDLVAQALGADLAGTAQNLTLRLRDVAATGTDGDRRVNALTGRDEVLSGGYWLAVPGFAPAADTCAAEVAATLASNRIGFVTGSARLDARARGAVNALAAVLAPCLTDAGLRAEIGGHTDSTGSPEANLALSLERARSVREALLARGLPAEGLTAQGYGAAEPVADNATEEGRAANRRTAVRWIE